MHGIPSDFDLSEMLGERVTLIGLDQYHAYLHLDRFTFSIEYGYRLTLADGRGETWERSELAPIPTFVTALLGLELTGWAIDGAQSIVLEFAGGSRIELFTDCAQYECVVISFGRHDEPRYVI